MKDVMIDLETLGITPQTAVLSLGACTFDPNGKAIGAKYYARLDENQQQTDGRTIDQSTLDWWKKQSSDARDVFQEQRHDTKFVLENFAQWFKKVGGKYAWGNGSSFDISILEDMYRMYNVKCPWLYYNVMDLRTFKRFSRNNEKLVKSGIDHNALDDAVSQANYVMGI